MSHMNIDIIFKFKFKEFEILLWKKEVFGYATT